jgi:hypothetical protein
VPPPDPHVAAAADAVMTALGWPEDRRTLVVEVVKTLDDHHLLVGSPTAPEPTLTDIADAAKLLATYSPRYDYPFGWMAIIREPGNLQHAHTAAKNAAKTPQETADIGHAYDVINRAQRRGTIPASG